VKGYSEDDTMKTGQLNSPLFLSCVTGNIGIPGIDSEMDI
jgi:hypothetical protein